MMRLRCPHNNCPIEVPDDMVGVRIRCPHCGNPLLIESRYCDETSNGFTVSEPAPGPNPNEPANLENHVYDGLPPLAMMMALRRRRGVPGYDDVDNRSKYEMTDDDWRALDAFEVVLRAGYRLRMALILGGAGAVLNLAVLLAMVAAFGEVDLGVYAKTRALGNLGSFLCLFAGLALIWIAGGKFSRLQRDRFTIGLPWMTLVIGLLLAGNVGLNLMTFTGLADGRVVVLMLAGAGICALATFATLGAFFAIVTAQARVEPPEIHHRLTEAMKYLE
ncbi:MAG: hypothetical protein HYX68_20665 [Planctomycetes bacterium]|nr:hypothetical protein [Planctomycetota bacterium]